MPILPPSLDDRAYDDLVDELLARIPAHTPEWTNPQPGDPGRTLVELFAWLADTMLYRANLIPERQRLAFLRLLGAQMRPAVAARGLAAVRLDEENASDSVFLAPFARVPGPVDFETLSELTVLPVTAEAYIKRRLSSGEARDLDSVIAGLRQVYRLSSKGVGYVTTPVFPGGAADLAGIDLMAETVDRCLWVALLAPKKELVADVRKTLGGADGTPRLLSVGVAPALQVPDLTERIGERARIRHVWEITTGREPGGEPEYLPLDVIDDSAQSLSRRGVVRLALPGADDVGAPENDVLRNLQAGVGRNRPPRIDDPERAARLVTWLRLRPTERIEQLALCWVGVNAVEVDQRQTVTGRVVGQSDGNGGQVFQLPARSVESESFVLQVEEPGQGYAVWRQTDDLATSGRDDAAYELDSEAGTVRFGDGVRGRIPGFEMRVRVGRMRAGGGRTGNLPAGALSEIKARDLEGKPVVRKLVLAQPLPTDGGADTERLADAERRIPALIRHRDRAVTPEDFRQLAADTPGVSLGRVEVLPRFKPQQRRDDVPGVVSVMVLPYKGAMLAPNPRADRPTIETVSAWLDARRPLTCEMYVIGCEYVPLALGVGIAVRDGFGHDQVINDVRDALRQYLWPLPPGGPDLGGWPLGRAVGDRELEVAVARVAGVSAVSGVNLFRREVAAVAAGTERWRMLPRARANAAVSLGLESWQLPELLGVVVVVGDPPSDLRLGDTATDEIPIPVVPEVC
jgi:predicted phage baseplate assembly protein